MKTNLRLKAVILQSGLKQFFVASKAGIDATRLSKIVGGHVVPQRDEMESLARVLGSPAEHLFPGLATGEEDGSRSEGV